MANGLASERRIALAKSAIHAERFRARRDGVAATTVGEEAVNIVAAGIEKEAIGLLVQVSRRVVCSSIE